MARLETQDVDRLREIQNELRTLVDGAPPALGALVPAMRDLLRVDRMLAYVLAPRGEGLRIEQGVTEGMPSDTIPTFDEWLRDKNVGWAVFNPFRPEPEQRNVVLRFDPPGHNLNLGATPVMRELLPRIGLQDCERVRVVVCDGPSMLAWIGAFQPQPFDERQIGIIEELVPAIQRRLKIERLLATADVSQAVTAAAFDAIPAAAFVIGEGGEVHTANTAGQLLLDSDSSARSSLRHAVRGEARDFEATRVTGNGMPVRFLVTHRASADARAEARAASSAARWSLTRRQREVLALLVRGLSNRTIAATLGMAEKTVEVHLTAMFEKAQVVSRAALVAKVWSS
jgi:DNA-binding CsgD family transcriptional regulator